MTCRPTTERNQTFRPTVERNLGFVVPEYETACYSAYFVHGNNETCLLATVPPRRIPLLHRSSPGRTLAPPGPHRRGESIQTKNDSNRASWRMNFAVQSTSTAPSLHRVRQEIFKLLALIYSSRCRQPPRHCPLSYCCRWPRALNSSDPVPTHQDIDVSTSPTT